MPTPITHQSLNTNSMKLYKDQAAGVDADGIIRNMSWSPRIVAKATANYTCLGRETGTFFTTTGLTAATTFTLPANTLVWYFEFFNGADQSMTVATATADTAVSFNDLTADSVAFSTSSEKIGGHIIAFCDGTTPFVIGHSAKESQHITINT